MIFFEKETVSSRFVVFFFPTLMNNKLTFNNHVNTVTQKATKMLNLYRRNLKMCSTEVKETAYKSLVGPHLEYASSACSPFTSRSINMLDSVQRRAVRFVLGNYIYVPESQVSCEIENKLNWQSLQHSEPSKTWLCFYQIKTGLCNISFLSAILPSPYRPNYYLYPFCIPKRFGIIYTQEQ